MSKYEKLHLMQVEKGDLPDLLKFIRIFENVSAFEFDNIELVNSWYEGIIESPADILFSIRGLKEGGFGLHTVGFCIITDIDWVSRTSVIEILMKDGDNPGTIPYNYNGKEALQQILDFAFKELNLNKVVFEVVDGNDIIEMLGKFGFLVEGVRRESYFKRGDFVDITVLSLLSREYLGRTK